MRVLDLFSGLGGWSRYFKVRGHEVVTVDSNAIFRADIVKDILKLSIEDLGQQKYDIILASPPCTYFSIAHITDHWNGDVPTSDGAKLSIELVQKTLELIGQLRPHFWIIENPKGKLNKLDLIQAERRYVTYCKLGKNYQKPTYLWGQFPPSLKLPDPCTRGHGCLHGKYNNLPRSYLRNEIGALIPIGLSKLVCLAAERDLEKL